MKSNRDNIGRAINAATGRAVRAAQDTKAQLPKEIEMQGSRSKGRPGPNLRIGREELNNKIRDAAKREAKRVVQGRKKQIKKAAAKQAGRLQKSASDAALLQHFMAQRSRPQASALDTVARRFAAAKDPLEKAVLGEQLTYERLRRLIAVRGR